MPLFDYRCAECHRIFESLVDRWDSPAPPCPHCGAAAARKQLSVFAVGTASDARLTPRRESGAGPCGSPDCACRSAME